MEQDSSPIIILVLLLLLLFLFYWCYRKRSDKKRNAVVDGCNVLFGFTGGNGNRGLPDARALEILLAQAKQNKYKIKAIFMRNSYLNGRNCVKNPQILKKLQEQKLLQIIKFGDDDAKLLEEAVRANCAVISNDNFRQTCYNKYTNALDQKDTP